MSFLLAIAALAILAIGVLIGRYYVPDDRSLRRRAGHADAYMRALEHLLRRDDQAAIDELRTVVADNVTALEPYFALASLFRSRGEWERAVRVHQAIAIRKDSNKPERLRARYELGLDFRAAGMPRRATRGMEEVLGADPKHLGSLRALCGLYEEQGRYAEAADVWARLRKLSGEGSEREPHLWAAAAQKAAELGEPDSARAAIKSARKLDDEDPHVWAAAAEVEAARDNAAGAAANLRTALKLAPDWAIYLVPALLEAHRGQRSADTGSSEDEERYRAAAEATVLELESLLDDVGDNPFLLLAIAELRSHFDADAAVEDFRRASDLYPDLLAARVASARLALASGDTAEIRGELVALVGPDGALAWATRGAWRCEHCGSQQDGFFWRCGECRQWATAALKTGGSAEESSGFGRRERRRGSRLWGASDGALPAPSIDAGDAESVITVGLLGRAQRWLRGTFSRPGQ